MTEGGTPGGMHAQVLRILDQGRPGTTMCPSDVARKLDPAEWRALLPVVRAAAFDLADAALLEVTQAGAPVDGRQARGPVRLRALRRTGVRT